MKNYIFSILSFFILLFIIESISFFYLKRFNPNLEKFRNVYINNESFVQYQNNIPQAYLNYISSPNLVKEGFKQNNEHGYRGGLINIKKNDCLRILALGGSTTYGAGVKNPEESYPFLLKEYLTNKLDTCVEIINGGVLWGTSAELLTHFQFKYKYYKPDIVIINTGGNDADSYLIGEYQPDFSNWRKGMVTLPESNKFSRLVMHSKFLSILISELFFSNIYNGGQFVHKKRNYIKWFDNSVNPSENMFFNSFYNNIGNLISQSTKNNSKVILMSFQSNPNTLSEEKYRNYYNLHESFLDSLSKINKVKSIHFPNEIINSNYWVDNCHLNRKGNMLKAKYVGEFILNNRTYFFND